VCDEVIVIDDTSHDVVVGCMGIGTQNTTIDHSTDKSKLKSRNLWFAVKQKNMLVPISSKK